MPNSKVGDSVKGRQCWTCQHWWGEYSGRYTSGEWVHIICHSHPPDIAVHVAPRTGCAFWRREPGADDEPHEHSIYRKDQPPR